MRHFRTLIAAALVATLPAVAFAQTSPGLVRGQVLTAAQWNQLFVNKQDTLGYVPVNKAGDIMAGRLVTAAPDVTAGLNLAPGSAPSAPVNGDLWVTTAGLYGRINGATVGPFGVPASSSFAGTSPVGVTFPAGVVTYAFDFSVANTFLAQQINQGASTTSPGWYAQIAGDTTPRMRVGMNATNVASLAFGPGNAVRDTFIERAGAASLRFGAPDAAVAVAQTLGVQNVVAGTSNTAGADWTLQGSRGTGTGAGGKIIFQTAPAGSSGSSQNSLVSALTLNSSGGLSTGSTSDMGAGTLNVGSGFYIGGVNINTFACSTCAVVNSSNTFTGASQITQSATTTSPGWFAQLTGDAFPRVRLGLNSVDGAGIGFGSGSAARDTFLDRLAAASFRLGAPDAAAPVAQTLGVQNVVAGTTNTSGADLTINGSRGTGSGTGGSIIFKTSNGGSSGSSQNTLTSALTISGAGGAIFGGGTDKGFGSIYANNKIWAQGGFAVASTLISSTAPTISSGCGAGTISAPNGTAGFVITTTAATSSSCVLAMPATATNGWACMANNLTTFDSTHQFLRQTASAAGSITLVNYNSSSVAANFAAGDTILVSCMAY